MSHFPVREYNPNIPSLLVNIDSLLGQIRHTLPLVFLPSIHIVQTTGTKWRDGRRFARGKLKGIRAKFMKKFQCFPYSSAPILKWAVTIPLITPKTKSGPDEMTSRLNLIFDGP